MSKIMIKKNGKGKRMESQKTRLKQHLRGGEGEGGEGIKDECLCPNICFCDKKKKKRKRKRQLYIKFIFILFLYLINKLTKYNIGTGESGKSTTARQLQIIYLKQLNEQMGLMGRLLQQNIIHGMQILIKGATGLFKEELDMQNAVCILTLVPISLFHLSVSHFAILFLLFYNFSITYQSLTLMQTAKIASETQSKFIF